MSEPVKVTLNFQELRIASSVGVERHIDSLEANIVNQKVGPDSDWVYNINGACSECAVAKYLGLYWGGHVRSFKNPDIGDLQVRSTTYKDGHLIIKENDNPDHVYVLVIASEPDYYIVGAIKGSKAKEHKKRDDGKSWWIPQSSLRKPEILLKHYGAKNG